MALPTVARTVSSPLSSEDSVSLFPASDWKRDQELVAVKTFDIESGSSPPGLGRKKMAEQDDDEDEGFQQEHRREDGARKRRRRSSWSSSNIRELLRQNHGHFQETDAHHDALVARELSSLTERHVRAVEASFYSKAKTLLLLRDRWTWGLAARTLTALCSIWLQQFALHGVDASLFFVWRFGQRIDDDVVVNTAFPGGPQYPANYEFMNSYDTSNANSFGVPSSTWLTLLFCVFAVVLEMHDVVEEQRVLYLLVRRGPAFCAPSSSGVCSWACWADPLTRWLAAWILHGARFCLLLKFLAITVELLGTSDGPLELVLNSLALGFVLEFDQAASLILTADGPLKHSVFGRLTVGRYRRATGAADESARSTTSERRRCERSALRTPLERTFSELLFNATRNANARFFLVTCYNFVISSPASRSPGKKNKHARLGVVVTFFKAKKQTNFSTSFRIFLKDYS